MEPFEAYKYLGLLYFVIIWAAMLYILGREPHDITKTVSRHVAASRETFIMFAVLRTLMLPLWMLFVFGWLVPALRLPAIASFLFAASIGAEMISAWVPAVEGRKGKVHSLSAFAIAAMYLPLSIIFVTTPHISELARIIITADILLMITGCVWFVAHRKSREYYLYFQLSYFIFFDTAFLAAAFL